MSLVGFSANNHPQQRRKRGADKATDDRRTPSGYWDPLHAALRFTLDAAATEENAKLPAWCQDGLSESWVGHRVWCNPPYSDIRPWVEKAWMEFPESPLIAMLLPANRCEQVWWQELVEPYRDRQESALRVRFLGGRMRFDRPGWVKPEKGDRPPFGLCLLLWTLDREDWPDTAQPPRPARLQDPGQKNVGVKVHSPPPQPPRSDPRTVAMEGFCD